jgi:hypothetical protein
MRLKSTQRNNDSWKPFKIGNRNKPTDLRCPQNNKELYTKKYIKIFETTKKKWHVALRERKYFYWLKDFFIRKYRSQKGISIFLKC